MAKVKRPRRLATRVHFQQLGRQLWEMDWYQYKKPAWRIGYDWAGFILHVSSSSRLGEYFESGSRRGSGMGLRYTDIQLVVFRNEYGNLEFAFQAVWDAEDL
ncbi:hypothetical protein QBC42DRAFT_282640 [Cladorrhinum samala]|uniref:Uncharacterized protein n=1 Tax=Cladorrhinum samala TaxID=585594 RepID=A0AAV9I491_9PEZI|nr:hypothetical protein QBC42DRAFT_282640 [Cladorrhinum samala]